MKLKPIGYWTKERCHKEALKYNTRGEFSKKSSSAYARARNMKWMEEICSHMKSVTSKPNGYWTKEKCHEEALKYSHKKNFYEKSLTAYEKSINKNWINEICSHMKDNHIEQKRCIYAHEFSDKCVYIGLTNNLSKRTYTHYKKTNNNSSVYEHFKKIDEKSKVKQLTDYINERVAIIKENQYVKIYKLLGWYILNKNKTGNLGGGKIKWTKEKCQVEALKYNNKTNFYTKSKGAYEKCIRKKWLDEICSHMIEKNKPNGYWTKKRCHEEALKYNSRGEFYKNSTVAYDKAQKNKWLDEICSHMKQKIKQKGYWTKERCHKESLKYNSRGDFQKKNSNIYQISRKNKWLDEICSHMKNIRNLQ